VLKLDSVDVSIQSVQILRRVSLELPSGTMAGLIGRNGAGKTTLMKSIMGILKVGAGSIGFDGADLLASPTWRRTRMGIGYMPEDRRLIPELTVEENLLLPAWAIKLPDAAARLEKVYRLIPEIKGFAPRKGTQLSGGQQKMVAIGRALMCGDKLLLLDEPFEGVAPALAHRLVEVVGSLKLEGMSVILSESDLQHSERMVDRIFVIDRGSVSTRA
jgi:branched-chain amino acid transport system ATP-binding protein